MRRFLHIGLLALLAVGCGSPAQETPEQGLQAIIALYEARDFDALIRTRYAELDKARDEAQVKSLITRFETTFADSAALERAVATYEAALATEPDFDQQGATAVFGLEEGVVRLSRMADGRWGFRL